MCACLLKIDAYLNLRDIRTRNFPLLTRLP
jgi:hypothetical protein